jgi:hypothetical protein
LFRNAQAGNDNYATAFGMDKLAERPVIRITVAEFEQRSGVFLSSILAKHCQNSIQNSWNNPVENERNSVEK